MFTRKRLSALLFSVPLMATLVFFSSATLGQEKPNPILEQVKAKVKGPKQSFTMLVTLKVKDDVGAKFEAAFAPAIKTTRKEKGCIAYDLNRDADNPNTYILYERWKTVADLDAHLKAEHITSLLPKLGEYLAGPPELKVLFPKGN